MLVYPAIDLRGGRCVRLLQGRADAETVYSDKPEAMAQEFAKAGASWIHVVDLDGAFGGSPENSKVVEAINAVGLSVQLGGGLRDEGTVSRVLDSGVSRAVIGTRAAEDPDFVGKLVESHGDKIAVGIDARDGFVAVKGWVEITKLRGLDLARQMEDRGVGTIIYTDIATDGMLTGPNIAALTELLDAVKCNVIASGGVASLEHVEELARISKEYPNLHGVITGKAIYEGKLDLPAAIQATQA